MKIGFLLGSPGISGGSYVIYEHASRLKRRGHQVAIITRQAVRPEEHAWHSSAQELDWLMLKQAKTESFDLLLATWWQTPFLLGELRAAQYAYFVQSIESRFFDPPDPQHWQNTARIVWREMCDKTYSYAIPMITEAVWIQNYLHKNYNNQAWLVRNGIRKDVYTAEGEAVAPRKPGFFRVLVEGPVNVFFKNVAASLRLARQAGADEIWLLTSSDIREQPDADRVFSRVPIHATPAIYRSCDLVLKLSYVEGMFGPPLEMFHCGGTALVYDVTGHDEYIAHDQNAYVVNKDNEEEVVRLLRHLKGNPAELARLKKGAARTAAAWPDWEVSSAQFEQSLLEIAATKNTSRTYLRRYTKELFDAQKTKVRGMLLEAFAGRERAVWEGTAPDQNNFFRLFWDSRGKFTNARSQHHHYLSGEWVTLSFELKVKKLPLWLRLDPSVRIGITEIAFITVRNATRDKEIICLREPDDFRTLFLAKDVKWIFPERSNIFFNYGPDPIILLPTVDADQADCGDSLELSVKMKETGVQQFFAEQKISIIGSAKQDKDDNSGIFRLYWDGTGNFTRQKSQWQHYPGEEWTTLSFELQAQEMPLWLRVDPSRRIGILEIAFIIVLNKTKDKEIMAFRQNEDFNILFLTGDLQWIFPERKNTLLSCGANPICLLPQLKQGDADPGDMLELKVRLKERSLQQFFSRHQISIADKKLPNWKRMLQKIKENI